MMETPQATFRSAVWNHVGKILEYLLMYVTSILIARGLGVQENGTFVGMFSISQLLLVLTSFGLETSLNKHIPQLTGDDRNDRLRFVLQRALSVRMLAVVSLAIVIFAATRASVVLLPPPFSTYVWLLLAYTGLRSFVNLLSIVLVAELETRTTSIINVITKGLESGLIGLLAANEMTTTKVLMVLLLIGGLQLTAYVIAARSHLFGKIVRHAVAPIITFGGIYWINTIVEYFLGRQGDVLLLTALLPDSTQASLYDVAFAVSQLASLSMTIGLGGITLATAAKLAMRETEVLERFYGFMIRVTSLLSIPLYAYILFNASSVLSVLYSSKFIAAAGLVQSIAAFRIVGRLFGGPENAEYLLSRSIVTKLVGIGVIGAVVNVGLDVLLIPKMKAMGAVIGSGCGNITVNLLGALTVYRNSSAKLQVWFWYKVVATTGIASLVCSLVVPTESVAMIGLQVVAYLVLTFSLLALAKPLLKEDWYRLSRINSRIAAPLRYFVRMEHRKLEVEPT